MTDQAFNVPFLCTGNSARSIFAESIVNRIGRGKFRGYSAGSHPRGEVHPMALYELEQNNYSTDRLRRKDWNEFAKLGAPHMDFFVTVCDKVAAEVCPIWPSQPMTAHWRVENSVDVEGDELTKRTAFATDFREPQNRISIFVNLPFDSLDRLRLQEKRDEIGRTRLSDTKELAA